MEATSVAPVSESSDAWQLAEESTTDAGRLRDGERSAPVEDWSATILKTTIGTAGPSGAETEVASDAPGFGSMKPVVPEGLMASPKATQGMVKPTVQPQSPPVVPPAATEEEDVVEIVRAEPRTQSVRIFRKQGDEVVVVEEEDTPKEMRWLKSALARVIKQIEVNTESGVFVSDVGDRIPSFSL